MNIETEANAILDSLQQLMVPASYGNLAKLKQAMEGLSAIAQAGVALQNELDATKAELEATKAELAAVNGVKADA